MGNIRSKLCFALVVLSALFVYTGCQNTIPKQELPKAELNQKVPDFTLSDMNGNSISISDFSGDVIILDFFAEWCMPCRMEIPHFAELYSKYKDKGFAMIGLSVGYLDAKGMRTFAAEQGINYPVLMNDGRVSELFRPINSLPTTFIIDKQGNIAKIYIGYRDKEVFEQDITDLLK